MATTQFSLVSAGEWAWDENTLCVKDLFGGWVAVSRASDRHKADGEPGCVAAPIELVTQPGCRFVEWRGEFDGQKFERVEYAEIEVLASEPSLKIAIVRVLGTTAKRAVVLARTDALEFHRDFAATSCRASSPRPLEPVGVKVQGLASARAAPELPGAEFFRVAGGLDFMALGGPLVTEKGELAAVAVGHFWDSRLYCPADSLRKMIDGLGSTE